MLSMIFSFCINFTSFGQCALSNLPFNVPTTNTFSDGTTNLGTTWQRSTYSGGWTVATNGGITTYNHPTTRTSINVGTANNLDFGVGDTDYFSDQNFSTIQLPQSTNPGSLVSNPIRVGRKLNPDPTHQVPLVNGNANFVTFNFSPTASNSKIRIWYIGAGQSSFDNVSSYNFNNDTDSNPNYREARFGVVCKYRYDSPLAPITTSVNSTIGMDEYGIYNPNTTTGTPTNFNPPGTELSQKYNYGMNDLFAGIQAGTMNGNGINTTTADFVPVSTASFNKMTTWRYYDLDFSQFVGLNTTITITLFAHSNKSSAASLQSAYAYYAFQCLGSGGPTQLADDFIISDVDLGNCLEQRCYPLNVIQSSNVVPIPANKIPLSPNWAAWNYNNNSDLYWLSLPDAQGLSCEWNEGNPLPIIQPNHFATAHLELQNSTGGWDDFHDVSYGPAIGGIYIVIDKNKKTGTYTTGANAGQSYFNFKLYYSTLHQNFTVKNFTVTGKFQTTLNPPCNIDNGGNLNVSNIVYCEGSLSQNIITNNNCVSYTKPEIIAGSIHYQWKWAPYDNISAFTDINPTTTGVGTITTNPNLTITDALLNDASTPNANCTIVFKLFTYYDYDYHQGNCSTGSLYAYSDTFTVYQLGKQPFTASTNCTTGIDVCYGQTIQSVTPLNLNLNFSPNACSMPTPPFTNNYTQTIQLYNPLTNQNIGNPIIVNATGPITIPITTPILIDSANGYQPTLTNNSFWMGLRVSTSFMSCNTSKDIPQFIRIIVKPRAVAGTINLTDLCSSPKVESPTNSYQLSFGGLYAWQYKINNGSWQTSTQTGTTFLLSSINGLTTGMVVQIKRISRAFPECHDEAETNIVTYTVPNNPTPTFSIPSSLCQNAVFNLPIQSNNTPAISGYWTQGTGTTAVTQIDSAIAGTATYVFHYNNTVNGTTCNNTVSYPVTINSSSPATFTGIPAEICNGSPIITLPTTSSNNVVGIWTPATVSNINSGTYVFHPTNSCVPDYSIPITVIPICGIGLTWGSNVGCQMAHDGENGTKPIVSINDGVCIKVCENTSIVYTLVGATNTIVHTVWNVTGGTQTAYNNTSVTVLWGTATNAVLHATITLNNGTILEVNKCIEKMVAPTALFTVLPFSQGENINVCLNNPVCFKNLSINNGGEPNIYYNWNFDDGTSSTEFEPCHTFNRPGIYKIELVAFNGCNCRSRYAATIHVEDSEVPINCPAIICEGQTANYTIPERFENCSKRWIISGGSIIGADNEIAVNVIWDHVDASGFGSLFVQSECFRCAAPIKIPVVAHTGTIAGRQTICPGMQSLYSLPQWPSTDFVWTIDNHGTGALLLVNNNRNEIIVQAGGAGIIDLNCTYTNTLLGCTGTAHFTINVLESIALTGNFNICLNSNSNHYTITDNQGNPVTIHWVVTGPNNFSQSGNSNSFDIVFPQLGTYIFTTTDSNYCQISANVPPIEVYNAIPAPTTISGPTTVCPNLPIIYSCVVPQNTIAHWSVTNGAIVSSTTGSSVSIGFFPSASTYTVNVWFTNNTCSSSILATTINKIVPNLAMTSGSQTVCGSSYEIYTVANSGADSYTWSIIPATAGSIQTGQNTNTVKILWNQQGQIAQIKLVEQKCGASYTNFGLANAGTYFPVTIGTSLNFGINAPSSTCVGDLVNVSLNNLPTNTIINSVRWDFGDNTPILITTSSNASHSYTNVLSISTTYLITATVYANGCVAPSVQTFQITVSPSPVASITPVQDINLCTTPNIPANLTYSVNLVSGTFATNTVQWFQNNTVVGTGPTYVVPYGLSSIGDYYALITNNSGCSKQTNHFSVYNSCPVGGCTLPYHVDGTVINTGCQTVTGTVTLQEGNPYDFNWVANLGVPITINPTTHQFIASNVEPGIYNITLNALYHVGLQTCSVAKQLTVTVPYKAGIKWHISCAGLGTGYNVQLLDNSVFYATTPIQQYEFTTDNGLHWTPATVIANIQQFNISALMPGTYQVGIRISTPGYAPCVKIENLVLPAFPFAGFTHDDYICQNQATHFYAATPANPNLIFNWTFNSDGSTNLQHDPVKIFPHDGSNDVTLTVTNILTGCSASTTQSVTVLISGDMQGGSLSATPPMTCQGNSSIITYDPQGSTMPVEFVWYKDNVAAGPIATTTVPTITVNQTGYYFVYVKNSYGCWRYNCAAIPVSFIALPPAPQVVAPNKICLGAQVTASISTAVGFTYTWTLNGVPKPQWNNLAQVTYTPTTPGVYNFGVTAQLVLAGGTIACSSPAGFATVNVYDNPHIPIISIDRVYCNPYLVQLSVANPSPGATYTWSNGAVGTHITMTHDGPVRVTATIYDCTEKAQIILPRDLVALAWIFPKGCFSMCALNPFGAVLGPLGNFESWAWIENSSIFQQGIHTVSPLTLPTPVHDYQLYLNNGYCENRIGMMNVSEIECENCNIEFQHLDIGCFLEEESGLYVYEINVDINNPNAIATTITLSVGGMQGIFIPNSVLVPSGISHHTIIFQPQYGFEGGVLPIHLSASNCEKDIEIEFPKLCGDNHVKECNYKQTIYEVKCMPANNAVGFNYEVGFEYDNYYNTPLTITYMALGGEGTFMPNSVTIPANSHLLSFIHFNPLHGFNGGLVTVMAYGLHDGIQCFFEFQIDFKYCSFNKMESKIFETNKENALLLAPNPAQSSTTVYYNYVVAEAVKEIFITDMLGRTLQSYQINEEKGTIEIDCSKLAHGQYMVLMKENGVVIKNGKLVVE